MKITEYISPLRENIEKARELGKTIILIPTMGYLHSGHLSMIGVARADDEDHEKYYIVMSIFVNPIQFGPNEDYEKYPRNMINDIKLAEEAGVDIVFAPEVEEMYPDGQNLTTVKVSGITEDLCGASRPVHFEGVTTVVAKLFNIVRPDVAYFGQKDYQQFMVIKQMARDLNIPVKLIAVPTIREKDGLALSSRNLYLSETERKQAPELYQALQEGKKIILGGEKNVEKIKEIITHRIQKKTNAKIEYLEIRRAENLAPLGTINNTVVIAVAARFGKTRLIDNILVEV
ncbi:MAG: pantoate--beta-alanine ligase [Eubacteriales bacterium]